MTTIGRVSGDPDDGLESTDLEPVAADQLAAFLRVGAARAR
jgi:hypothetical protein